MHKRTLTKPDGRLLHLYSRRPVPEGIVATAPRGEPVRANPHRRWHPLRGEWVIYASHRQERTFLPPPDYSPLATTKSPEFPTEMPSGDYEAAVFENRFPSLAQDARDAPSLAVPTEPAAGACEVVVFTQDPNASLGGMPLDRVALVLEILAERTRDLARDPRLEYLLAFENRGVEMGVTLHHPHGQIYAYSFVPPVPARMLGRMEEHHRDHGRGLIEDLLADELRDGRRIVAETPHALSFVPVCARYPYETWIAPRKPVARISELGSDELRDLARALKTTLGKYDALWSRPMPYLLSLFQAPLRGEHPAAHVHFQITPALRTRDRLKYLAGTELAGGVFVNDSIPEEKAAELRAVRLPGEEER